MSGSTILFIIIFINVFLMGMLAPYLYRYAMAHFRPVQDPENNPEVNVGAELPPEIKDKILKQSQEQFERVLKNSATYLQSGLVETATDLNNLVKNLVTDIINSELENYHKDLAQLRQKAEQDLAGVRTEMDGHKAELKANLAKEIEAEKQKLIKQLDTKLGDAFGSFLVEALGHDVDLGSQNEYLSKLLEEHKAEFVKELADDKEVVDEPTTKPAA